MKFILYLLIAILVILFCLPVVLLPMSTSVPAWAWILIALADAALIKSKSL